MNLRPKASTAERSFNIEDLFFSTTDKRGVILTGNDVFQRISGYSFEQLIGSPHNIIRHPDMPKAVFKLLWDTIQADRMIAAYVKNMAADGCYYWVLAVVFPIGEKFLSIRLKPSSALQKVVEEVYVKTLKKKKKHGVEASVKVLFANLEAAGFQSYEQFMTAAIYEELKGRDHAQIQKSSLLRSTRRAGVDAISKIEQISAAATLKYQNLFSRIGDFEQSRIVFKEQVGELLRMFKLVRLLATNMRIFSTHIGENAASLGVVAQTLQVQVDSIGQYIESFSKQVDELCGEIQNLSLDAACLKVQMDMVDFFVQEVLKKVESGGEGAQFSIEQFTKNEEMFLQVSETYFAKAAQELQALKRSVGHFSASESEIREFVNAIEFISQVGAVESARIESKELDFRQQIKGMKEFSENLKKTTNALRLATTGLAECNSAIEQGLTDVTESMRSIFSLAEALRQQESAG